MIKQFNHLLKNKNLSTFLFSNLSQPTHQVLSQNIRHSQSLINLNQAISYDTQNNFYLYPQINKKFNSLIETYHKKLQNKTQSQIQKPQELQKSLQNLSQYPLFYLDQDTKKNLYQILHENIHTKNPQYLQKALIFMIMTDKNTQKTKLYEQFARFYLKSQQQLLKSRFSLNLQNQNVISSIKKLIMSFYQRGFFSRTPGYIRNLYITNHVLILNKMIQKEYFRSSLMLKKVLYEYFLEIKQFYESEMKQNLYHERNTLLLEKIRLIIKVLCQGYEKKIDLIEAQCQQLRQIYMKLFLVIQKPNLQGCMFMYHLIKNNCQILQCKNIEKESSFQKSKEKQVLKHQSSSKIEQNSIRQAGINNTESHNELLAQFIQKVQRQVKDRLQNIFQNGKQQIKILNQFGHQEIVLILKYSKKIGISQQSIRKLSNYARRIFSSLAVHISLTQIICLLQNDSSQQLSQMSQIFTSVQSYRLMSLEQVAQLSESNFVKKTQKIKSAILKHIVSADIKHIGNSEILSLLKIFKATYADLQKQHQEIQQHRLSIINFVLRFLADHHKSLQFDSLFQQILKILFNFQKQSTNNQKQIFYNCQNLLDFNFNDQNQNYSLTILEEMKQFLNRNVWKIKNKALRKLIKQKLQNLQ